MAQQTPKLTAIERIGPKGYLRYVFPFQLRTIMTLTKWLESCAQATNPSRSGSPKSPAKPFLTRLGRKKA